MFANKQKYFHKIFSNIMELFAEHREFYNKWQTIEIVRLISFSSCTYHLPASRIFVCAQRIRFLALVVLELKVIDGRMDEETLLKAYYKYKFIVVK